MTSSASPTSVRIHPMSSNDDTAHHTKSSPSAQQTEHAIVSECHDSPVYAVNLIRNDIMNLSVLVGKLSASFLEHVPMDSITDDGVSDDTRQMLSQCSELSDYMNQLLSGLESTASRLFLYIPTCIVKKMELNRKKYPVELCKGKAGKYTEYSNMTGITKYEGQSTMDSTTELFERQTAPLRETLPELQLSIRQFAMERTWSKYHLPRNLLLALLGELGELAEVFQWCKDEPQKLSSELVDKVGQEIADVTIYLIRLSDVCGIDMST